MQGDSFPRLDSIAHHTPMYISITRQCKEHYTVANRGNAPPHKSRKSLYGFHVCMGGSALFALTQTWDLNLRHSYHSPTT